MECLATSTERVVKGKQVCDGSCAMAYQVVNCARCRRRRDESRNGAEKDMYEVKKCGLRSPARLSESVVSRDDATSSKRLLLRRHFLFTRPGTDVHRHTVAYYLHYDNWRSGPLIAPLMIHGHTFVHFRGFHMLLTHGAYILRYHQRAWVWYTLTEGLD